MGEESDALQAQHDCDRDYFCYERKQKRVIGPTKKAFVCTRGETAQYNCKNCGRVFTARTADRKRGWARFCDKSCKALFQDKKTGGKHRNSYGT